MRTALLALLWFAPAHADTFIGAGVDVVHEQGRAAFSFRPDPVTVLAWPGNVAIGAAYTWGTTFQFALGGIYVKDHERRVGTHENFLVVLRYCPSFCLSLNHISHASGRLIHYKPDRPNGGLNMLQFEFPL